MNSNSPANPHSFLKMKRKEKNEPSGVQTYNILHSSAFQRIQPLSIYFHSVSMNRFSGHALSTNNDALPAVFSYIHMELYGVFFFFTLQTCM